MTLTIASIKARRLSLEYGTFWYVREVSPNVFEPYAHHSDDERTVATYYNGQKYEEPK